MKMITAEKARKLTEEYSQILSEVKLQEIEKEIKRRAALGLSHYSVENNISEFVQNTLKEHGFKLSEYSDYVLGYFTGKFIEISW